MAKQDHRKKYSIVRPYLLAQRGRQPSIIDLGCSAGVMGFQAYLDGFRRVVFIDHDAEYLNLVRIGLDHIGASEPIIQQNRAQLVTSVADVLFVFALVHWLYSCTEDFGSLDSIVAKLSSICRTTLFIEWVGPECSAIQSFDHLSRNPEFHKGPYNKERFIEALKQHFPHVKRIGKVRDAREIWMASRSKCRPQLSLLVREEIGFLGSAAWAKLIRGVHRIAGPHDA
jgi:16S rRNA G966 N2-methylase RsmD